MQVVVVGGGASGMISAIEAAKNGNIVTLIEHNDKLGKKIYITGKGRCNLTNLCSPADFLSNVVTNSKFLYSAIYAFPPQRTIEYFKDLGLETIVERGERVFPLSNKSSDVTKALSNELNRLNVKILYNTEVTSCKVFSNKVVSLNTTTGIVLCDSVILACGGVSYKATGSNGIGYKIAKMLGHTIIEPKPSLVSFIANGCCEFEGLSLKNVTLSLIAPNGKIIKSDFGEMLFTSNGISGPIALTLSAYANRLDLKNYKLVINLKPALSINQLTERIKREILLAPKKEIKNILLTLLPERLVKVVEKQSEISQTIANSLTVAERDRLVNTLQNLSFDCLGLASIDQAIVTSGGVAVKEIVPQTMQSKLIPNLYFAGEIIDVDALTGGFNLQIAFATGYLAGQQKQS
ncbi:MAG: NAD(P)/FAD-dependent oxidoreductase [Clostridia bacterium]